MRLQQFHMYDSKTLNRKHDCHTLPPVAFFSFQALLSGRFQWVANPTHTILTLTGGLTVKGYHSSYLTRRLSSFTTKVKYSLTKFYNYYFFQKIAKLAQAMNSLFFRLWGVEKREEHASGREILDYPQTFYFFSEDLTNAQAKRARVWAQRTYAVWKV